VRNGRVNRLIGETGKIVMSVNRIKTIIETFLGSDMPGEVQQRFAEWLRDPASRDEKERALENYWNGLRAEEPGGRERKLERLHEAMRRGERFRVRRICGKSTILVKSGDTVIARFKRDRLAPGEMEHIALPRVLLDRAPMDEVTIEIEEA